MEFDLEDDYYKVEHGDNYVLTAEQLKKLIEAKFERNSYTAKLFQKQEDQFAD